MELEQAMKLIRTLADASVKHYQVVNGDKRGNAERAATEEFKAAVAILKELSSFTGTNDEIRELIEKGLWN